jgi:hypothetical protein
MSGYRYQEKVAKVAYKYQAQVAYKYQVQVAKVAYRDIPKTAGQGDLLVLRRGEHACYNYVL